MSSHELSDILVKIGFTLSCICNFWLIFLTVIHVKKINRTYKKMVIMFAKIGVLFSGLEIIARPFAHNYDNYLIYFSLNNWINSQLFLQIFMTIWAGFFIIIVVFISVQFVYRYLCLFEKEKIKYFDGWKSVFWILYPLIPAAGYGIFFFIVCQPNEQMDTVLRPIIADTYSLEIQNLSRFILTPYNPNGTFNLKIIIFLIYAIGTINFHYTIILFCGVKMHNFIKKGMQKFSKHQQTIQRQFFRALVFQSFGPTIFLVLPSIPLLITPLIAPYLNISINLQLGWVYSLVGLFPPFDSISFMIIVSEYRKVIKYLISACLKAANSSENVNQTGTNKTSDLEMRRKDNHMI